MMFERDVESPWKPLALFIVAGELLSPCCLVSRRGQDVAVYNEKNQCSQLGDQSLIRKSMPIQLSLVFQIPCEDRCQRIPINSS